MLSTPATLRALDFASHIGSCSVLLLLHHEIERMTWFLNAPCTAPMTPEGLNHVFGVVMRQAKPHRKGMAAWRFAQYCYSACRMSLWNVGKIS